jgi:hypothetical protein
LTEILAAAYTLRMELLKTRTPSIPVERGAFPLTLDRQRYVFFDMPATWLLYQRYGDKFLIALYEKGDGDYPKIRDVEVLAFFLWAGLQHDAKAAGEELTLERAADFIQPYSLQTIITAITVGLNRTMATPAPPGKTAAAAVSPAAVAQPGRTKASTSSKRSGSPSRSSTKRPKRSGR